MFVEIPADTLRRITDDIGSGDGSRSDDTPTLYHHPNRLIRKFFWLRLRWVYALIREHRVARGHVCDFGGGGGVFLPTLCRYFDEVTCVDHDLATAREVVSRLSLDRVKLRSEDILSSSIEDASFDCVVAADVLEHFRDLDPPVRVIRRWLKPDGYLVTSLPTENVFYAFLRLLFRVTKPADHYHTAAEVEHRLGHSGFCRVELRYLPLRVPLLALFRISLWKLSA